MIKLFSHAKFFPLISINNRHLCCSLIKIKSAYREKNVVKAHTGMKPNQDVKVKKIFLYLIVLFNILIDIEMISIFSHSKYFFN